MEPSEFLDQKLMEHFQLRTSYEPMLIEKQTQEDYWSFGREKRVIGEYDYAYEQNDILIRAVDGVNVTL